MTHHGGSAPLDSAERPMLSGSGAPRDSQQCPASRCKRGRTPQRIGIEYIDQPPGDGIIDDGPSLRSGRLSPDGGRREAPPARCCCRARDAVVGQGLAVGWLFAQRCAPAGFIEPALPSASSLPPTGTPTEIGLPLTVTMMPSGTSMGGLAGRHSVRGALSHGEYRFSWSRLMRRRGATTQHSSLRVAIPTLSRAA